MRRIQTFLKDFSTKNTILKNFSVLTISNALSQFLAIFTSIKIARALTPINYGTYNLLQLHVSIFVIVASFGLRNIIIRSIAREPKLIKNIFYISAILRAIGFFISIILFFIYFFLHPEYNVLLFSLVLVGILSTILFDLFESVAFGLEKMEFSGIINFLSNLFWLVTILIIPSKQLTLELIFGLFVLFSSLKTFVYFFSIYKKDYIKGFTIVSAEKKQVIEFSKESFPYYYLALLTLLSNQIPLLFLEYRSGVAQIGYFNIASKVLMPINLLLTTALAAVFPNLSRLFVTNHKTFIRNVKLIFMLIAVFGIAGAFGVTLFRKEVVYLLYGEKYVSSSLVLGYQCWYIAIYSVVCLIGTILGAINKQKELGYLSILCTIIQVPILWIGSKYGAQYLSAAFVVSTTIIFIIHLFVVNSYLKNELSFVFYLKIIALFILGYAISILVPVDLNIFYKAITFTVISFLALFFILRKYKNNISKIFIR